MRTTSILFTISAVLAILSFFMFNQLRGTVEDNFQLAALVGLAALFISTFMFSGSRSSGEQSQEQGEQGKESEQHNSNHDQDSELSIESSCYNIYSERYGIGFDEFDIACIIDDDGSATINREVSFSAFQNVSEIYTHLFPADESTSSQQPTISFLGDQSAELAEKIRIRPRSTGKYGGSSTTIHFVPPVKKGSSQKYRLTETASPGVFGDAEDYFGWYIDRPTKKLILRAYLPLSMTLDEVMPAAIYPNLTKVDEGVHQKAEELNLSPSVDYKRPQTMIELIVDYPIVGLIYMLRWSLQRNTVAGSEENHNPLPRAQS